ncbi:MAG: NAD(P)H-dependent oxidoreductase [Mariprofundaceae bacterium]
MNLPKINMLIVYHSDYGNTEKMAKAIGAGAKSTAQAHVTISLKKAEATENNDLVDADVILFGTPVHMGSMAWQLKKVVDTSSKLWLGSELENKIGGVFVTSGGLGHAGGGTELTMISLYSNFLQHGMIVIGQPRSSIGFSDGGLQWGAYARTGNAEGMPSGISEAALVSARSYGARVIELAERMLS